MPCLIHGFGLVESIVEFTVFLGDATDSGLRKSRHVDLFPFAVRFHSCS